MWLGRLWNLFLPLLIRTCEGRGRGGCLSEGSEKGGLLTTEEGRVQVNFSYNKKEAVWEKSKWEGERDFDP